MTKIDIAALRELHADKEHEQEWLTDYEAFAYTNIPALLDRIEELEGALKAVEAGQCASCRHTDAFKVREALTQQEPQP